MDPNKPTSTNNNSANDALLAELSSRQAAAPATNPGWGGTAQPVTAALARPVVTTPTPASTQPMYASQPLTKPTIAQSLPSSTPAPAAVAQAVQNQPTPMATPVAQGAMQAAAPVQPVAQVARPVTPNPVSNLMQSAASLQTSSTAMNVASQKTSNFNTAYANGNAVKPAAAPSKLPKFILLIVIIAAVLAAAYFLFATPESIGRKFISTVKLPSMVTAPGAEIKTTEQQAALNKLNQQKPDPVVTPLDTTIPKPLTPTLNFPKSGIGPDGKDDGKDDGVVSISYDQPLEITIPSLSITAPVVSVALSKDGSSIGVPNNPNDVGWYSGSTAVGDKGSSILVGHRSWKKDIYAVFNNLHLVKLGDVIIIHNNDQTLDTFVVKEMRVYDKDDSPAELLVSNGKKSRLVLVTCSGAWNEKEGTSEERLVVIADKFPE